MKLLTYTQAGSYIGELEEWTGLRVYEGLNDEGTFSFEIPMAEKAKIPWWSVIRFVDDDDTVLQSGVAYRRPQNTLMVDRADQRVQVSGSLRVCTTGSSKFGGTVILPERQLEESGSTRYWGWAQWTYDSSWWGVPYSLGTYANPTDPDLEWDPGASGRNEIQRVHLHAQQSGFPWGPSYPSTGVQGITGTWRLKVENQTTAAMQYNASNATIKSTLEALSGVDSVTITGSGVASTFDVEFNDGKQRNLMTLVHHDLRHDHGVSKYVTRVQGGAAAVEPEFLVDGWPDMRAEWLGRRGVWNYARRKLMVSANTAAEGPAAWLFVSMGDIDVYVDGKLRGSGEKLKLLKLSMDLATSDHLVAVKSRGPFMMTVVRENEDGSYGNVLYRSFTPAVFGGAGSPDPWVMLTNPDTEPGETLGKIVQELVTEGQARGWAPWLTLTFDETEDSAGVPWDLRVNHGWGTGTKLFWVLQQMTQWGMDFALDPVTGALSCWQHRGTDRTATVVYSVANRNVVQGRMGDPVTHDVTGPMVTALMAHTEGGWEYLHSDAHAAYGIWEDGAHFGNAFSVDQVRAAVQGVFRETAEPRWTSQVSTDGDASAMPWRDVFVGDRVTAIDPDGDAAPARLVGVAMMADDDTAAKLFQLRLTDEL